MQGETSRAADPQGSDSDGKQRSSGGPALHKHTGTPGPAGVSRFHFLVVRAPGITCIIGGAEAIYGIKAERVSLEDLAMSLSLSED